MRSNSLEHVYIVFGKETSIDEGIGLIEKTVLGDGKLEVTRRDVTGNAVVAIISTEERKKIKGLDFVEWIKVNRPAVKHHGDDVI